MRIKGEGSSSSGLFFIGEWPSRDDARPGRPFMGKVGREVDRRLDGHLLPRREDVYLTTWIKEWRQPAPGQGSEYPSTDNDRDLPELLDEIRRCNPTTIIPLGRSATRLFLGDVDLESVASIPWYIPEPIAEPFVGLLTPLTVIFPIYSPGAGFRSPELSSQVTYGFTKLGKYYSGEIAPRTLFDDPHPSPIYEDITDLESFARLAADLGSAPGTLELGADSEGYPGSAWSVQISNRPGHASVIRTAFPAIIAAFVAWVRECQPHFIFHNSLHDLQIFREIGLDTRYLTFDDTMIMSYNLQLEPQGLKPLCVRHCNMVMQDYDEVFGDAGDRLARDYLFAMLELEELDHETRCQEKFIELTTTPFVDGRGKTQSGRRLKVPPKLPRTDLHKSIERCMRSERPRKLWYDQREDIRLAARARLGDLERPSLDVVPLPTAIHYAGRDADGTVRVAPILREASAALDLSRVYANDLGTIPLIDRMQQIGLRPNLRAFADLSTGLDSELVGLRTQLASEIGRSDFNPNSSDQVADLLFERYGLHSLKNTPGGDPSTNDKILEALEEAHPEFPAIGLIREYREYYKLKSTFVDQIPYYTRRYPYDGRIHPTFRVTRVVSGRLAASDPNILAMPKHGKFAKAFRAGFVADPGHFLGSWDLNQIELRVLAHLSGDRVLLDAYRAGEDLHAKLAHRIFGVAPKDQDESKHRLPAKAVNFGIPMGMTEYGLTIELKKNGLKIEVDDARRWLADTADLYKGVVQYKQFKMAEARRHGFVRDLAGRIRYIGGIHSWDEFIRAEAERFAFSTPIQAGAQEIMKVAEKHVWESIILPLQEQGHWIEPLVQIHDDLVLEFDEDLLPIVHPLMDWAMTQTYEGLSLPIKTAGTAGRDWGHLWEIDKDFNLYDKKTKEVRIPCLTM